MAVASSPIRMRELPQIQSLELKLLLYGDDQHSAEALIERACEGVFGVKPSDIDFEVPEEYWELGELSPERLKIDEAL
jgi:hypothetical protein